MPLDLTAVVIAYNITDRNTKKPITDLTLTPRLVARLISDSDLTTFFHDPEFLKLNPGHTWPLQAAAPGPARPSRTPTRGSSRTGSTAIPRRASLLDGNDKYGIAVNPAWHDVEYPTDVFEARLPDGVYFPRVGEEGVAQRVFAETKPAESIPTDSLNAGFFGVLDLPTASRFRLPIARLTTGVGKPVVTLGPESARGRIPRDEQVAGGLLHDPADREGPAGVAADEGRPGDGAAAADAVQPRPPHPRVPQPRGHRGAEGPSAGIRRVAEDVADADARSTPATRTSRTRPPRRRPRRTVPFDPGYSDGGGSVGGYNDPGYVDDGSTGGSTATSTPTSRPRTRSVTTTTAGTAQLVGLALPDSGDRLVLPVVLGLALIALAVRLVEVTRNRTRGWKVRRR